MYSQSQETIDAVQEQSDYMHHHIAQQMQELFTTVVGKDVKTMEEFYKLDTQPGDIVICYKLEGNPRPFDSAWILFGEKGKCVIIGGQETEDIDWFLRFGGVDILRK